MRLCVGPVLNQPLILLAFLPHQAPLFMEMNEIRLCLKGVSSPPYDSSHLVRVRANESIPELTIVHGGSSWQFSAPQKVGQNLPPFPSTSHSGMLPRSHTHLEELKLSNYLLRTYWRCRHIQFASAFRSRPPMLNLRGRGEKKILRGGIPGQRHF